MYDVIIVGARCAGAALANLLGRKGYRILLLDRDTFPSHTTSTHVTGELGLYEKMGVLETLKAAGAPPLKRLHVHLGTSSLESDMLIAPWSLGLRRYYFDQILLQAAINYSDVYFAGGRQVTGVICQDGQVRGVRYRKKTTSHEVRARVVVGADGFHSVVAQAVQAGAYESSDPMRPAYYGYFERVKPLPVPAVEWFWTRDDIVFCNPTDSGLHSVLVMPPLEEEARWRKNPQEMLLQRTGTIAGLRDRMSDAILNGRVRGIGSRPMFLKEAYGNGWALVGDAGAYVHPVTGSGMDNAVASADMLAEALDAYLSGEVAWSEAMGHYQEQRDGRIGPQLQGAKVSMRRADHPLSETSLLWLQALCTFPGLSYDLAERAEEVVGMLGQERAGQLAKLVGSEGSKKESTTA